MPRIQLTPPPHFGFSIQIPVRITDINFAGHLGNDKYLAYLHEARTRFLIHHGHTELDIEGVAVIMGDSAIVYHTEVRYGEEISIEVAITDIGNKSFDIFYRLSNAESGKLIALAKTGMVCFDYTNQQTKPVPNSIHNLFASANTLKNEKRKPGA